MTNERITYTAALPDGTTDTRTSPTMEYTHAVIGLHPQHGWMASSWHTSEANAAKNVNSKYTSCTQRQVVRVTGEPATKKGQAAKAARIAEIEAETDRNALAKIIDQGKVWERVAARLRVEELLEPAPTFRCAEHGIDLPEPTGCPTCQAEQDGEITAEPFEVDHTYGVVPGEQSVRDEETIVVDDAPDLAAYADQAAAEIDAHNARVRQMVLQDDDAYVARSTALPAWLHRLIGDAIAEECRRFPHDAPTVPDVMGTLLQLHTGEPEALDEWINRIEARLGDLVMPASHFSDQDEAKAIDAARSETVRKLAEHDAADPTGSIAFFGSVDAAGNYYPPEVPEWQEPDHAEHAAVDAAVREEQEAEAAAEAKAERIEAEARRALQRYEVLVQYGIPTVEAADFVLRDTSPEVDQAVIALSDSWEYEPATNAAIVAELLGSSVDAETAAMVDAVPASISVALEFDVEALAASVEAQQALSARSHQENLEAEEAIERFDQAQADLALMAAQDEWEDAEEDRLAAERRRAAYPDTIDQGMAALPLRSDRPSTAS
jgi:hypothetical protein